MNKIHPLNKNLPAKKDCLLLIKDTEHKSKSNPSLIQLPSHPLHHGSFSTTYLIHLWSRYCQSTLWHDWSQKNTVHRGSSSHPVCYWCRIGSQDDRLREAAIIPSVAVVGYLGSYKCSFWNHHPMPEYNRQGRNSSFRRTIEVKQPRNSRAGHLGNRKYQFWLYILQR